MQWPSDSLWRPGAVSLCFSKTVDSVPLLGRGAICNRETYTATPVYRSNVVVCTPLPGLRMRWRPDEAKSANGSATVADILGQQNRTITGAFYFQDRAPPAAVTARAGSDVHCKPCPRRVSFHAVGRFEVRPAGHLLQCLCGRLPERHPYSNYLSASSSMHFVCAI